MSRRKKQPTPGPAKPAPPRPKWKAYDPTWLVELARQQRPEEPWLPHALARCTMYLVESRAYYYLTDAPEEFERPVDRQIMLEDKKEGTLILDVTADHHVFGVEFLKRI